MVSGLHDKRGVVVKVLRGGRGECATAKCGLGLAEVFASRLGFWSDCRRMVPPRRDVTQGYSTVSVVSSVIHGLLSGGRGLSSTEPLRGDGPLLKLLGLDRAPSAGTVEEVVKYLGSLEGGHAGLSRLLASQCRKALACEVRPEVLDEEGWFVVWADGTVLEVEGKCFKGLKRIDGKWGQLFCACFAGPYLAACDMAGEGVGEQSLVRRFVGEVFEGVAKPMRLARNTLFVLDSLHGDEPTLKLLESFEGAHYIVGGNKLKTMRENLAERPEHEWKPVRSDPRSGRREEAVCRFRIQCADWPHSRLAVGRRWKNKDEMIFNYSGVITDLSEDNGRVRARMERLKVGFELAVWSLYDFKQARENGWKELLDDMGLHHPPTADPKNGAIFYAIAALALNLATGVRRLGLRGPDRNMRLWRLRRELFDVAGRVAVRSRRAWLTVLDARDWISDKILQAAHRLALL